MIFGQNTIFICLCQDSYHGVKLEKKIRVSYRRLNEPNLDRRYFRDETDRLVLNNNSIVDAILKIATRKRICKALYEKVPYVGGLFLSSWQNLIAHKCTCSSKEKLSL